MCTQNVSKYVSGIQADNARSFVIVLMRVLKSELCIRTHPRLDSELPKLPVTRCAPNLTLTSETLTFSPHLVLDREERVLLSWLHNTPG